MKGLFNKIRTQWVLHLFFLLTNWLPDNVVFIKLRGRLYSWCLGSCGKRFGVGRNVTLYNSANIHIGHDVYIAYGCWLNGAGGIHIQDEVLVGPYCVLVSSNHEYDKGEESFRFHPGKKAPIVIGKGTWLAAHVTVTAGVSIGNANLIAANSVLLNNTQPKSMYGGVPAKLIKEI